MRSKLEDKEGKMLENIKILEEEISNFKVKISEHEWREAELAS